VTKAWIRNYAPATIGSPRAACRYAFSVGSGLASSRVPTRDLQAKLIIALAGDRCERSGRGDGLLWGCIGALSVSILANYSNARGARARGHEFAGKFTGLSAKRPRRAKSRTINRSAIIIDRVAIDIGVVSEKRVISRVASTFFGRPC